MEKDAGETPSPPINSISSNLRLMGAAVARAMTAEALSNSIRKHLTSSGYTSYEMYILEVPMQVAKWGNSLAVRLPRSVVEALRLKEGDAVDIHVVGARSFEVQKTPTSRELLRRLRKFRGRLPAGFRFDRLEANERG